VQLFGGLHRRWGTKHHRNTQRPGRGQAPFRSKSGLHEKPLLRAPRRHAHLQSHQLLRSAKSWKVPPTLSTETACAFRKQKSDCLALMPTRSITPMAKKPNGNFLNCVRASGSQQKLRQLIISDEQSQNATYQTEQMCPQKWSDKDTRSTGHATLAAFTHT